MSLSASQLGHHEWHIKIMLCMHICYLTNSFIDLSDLSKSEHLNIMKVASIQEATYFYYNAILQFKIK